MSYIYSSINLGDLQIISNAIYVTSLKIIWLLISHGIDSQGHEIVRQSLGARIYSNACTKLEIIDSWNDNLNSEIQIYRSLRLFIIAIGTEPFHCRYSNQSEKISDAIGVDLY